MRRFARPGSGGRRPRSGLVAAFLATLLARSCGQASATVMPGMAGGLMPHGICYLWNPSLVALHVFSDAAIALAYFSIPALLVYFIRKRTDIPLRGSIAMFAVFIVACGVTHVLEVVTVWHPIYWLSGGVKAFTALVSIATAVMLVPLIPAVLTFKSPAELERVNARLEKRYQRLIETAQEGMWTIDLEARVTFVNERFASMLGYTRSEMLGRSAFDFIPPGEHERSHELFDDQLRGVGSQYERSFERRDGTKTWVMCCANPIYDDNDVCIGALGTFADFNARREVELQLISSEARYRTLAEGLPQLIWTATDTGQITYYSSHWSKYTGLRMDELLASKWQTLVHPDDLPKLTKAWDDAIAQGEPYEAAHRMKGADGVYRWFLARALPVRDEAGTIVQWSATQTDIDDQTQALEAQRRMTEQLQLVVEASDRLSNTLDTRELLQTLCELVVPNFADWMAVNLVETDGRIRNVALVHGDPEKAEAVAALRGTYYVDPAVRGVIAEILETQRPILTSQYFATFQNIGPIVPEKRKAIAELGLESIVSVPLLLRGRVIGVMSVVWSQSGARYSEAEVPFFEALAKRAATAFDEATRHSQARVNEEINRRIMQSTDDSIAVLTPDARLMTVNEQGAAAFAAAGTTLAPGGEWLECWLPEDRAAVAGALSAAQAGSTGNYEARLTASDLEPQWWNVVVTPITNVAGTPTQLLAVSRNVTRQKMHESTLEALAARYWAFANAIPAIAFTATPAGVLDFVNERWIAYTGLSREESLHYGLITVTHAKERPTATVDWFDAIGSGRAHETETRLRRASDGTYRWHLMRAVAIRDDDGNIVQWFGTGTDIDDQKHAEAAILEARDAALEATTVKSQFVATMSHEIRTPMSGVIGMTELLLITQLTDEQREYASIVRDSGQSLLRVINDILDYSKLEAGRLQLEQVEFVVAGQLKSVTDLLRSQIDEKHITLTTRIDERVPERLVGDPGRVRQVLVNLVGNAVKFTPDGGNVHVSVACAPGDAQTSLRFEITDSGAGIAPSVRARLFEPFSQGDGSTTRKFGGTGLGLSICKQLVSLMDGTIGVESVLGEGATFWFAVPFNRPHVAVQPLALPSAPPLERRTAGTKRYELLLVEDNQINTLLALRQFQQLGHPIETVSNGREALEAVRTKRFDLIFMDCHMPEMDGFEATREIRRLEGDAGRHVPIIAMTADAQVEDQTACLAAGMDDYLSKPSSLTQIEAILERWLPKTF